MSTSFIHYVEVNMDKGFWINDWFIELVAEYLKQTILKNKGSFPEWLEQYAEENLDGVRLGYMPGCLDFGFEEFSKTTQYEEPLLKALEATKELLRYKGPEISDEELTSYEMQKIKELRRMPLRKKTLGRTESTAALIQIIDEIIKMIIKKENYNSEKHQPEFNFDIEE